MLVVWAADGADVSLANIFGGLPNIIEYLGRMIPPSGSILASIWSPLIETFQIAVVAIILTTIFALPASFMAAKNVMPIGVVYQVMRTVLGILRGIPPLLYAIIFVAMVGLGPFAGVLALVAHSIGAMGRFIAEAIENINPEIPNAAKATGANKLKIIIYAIVPEVRVLIFGYILYYFEYNVRTSTVLGLVGAGGIGFLLMTYLHLFQYPQVATILLVIVAVITVMDKGSAMVRERLV